MSLDNFQITPRMVCEMYKDSIVVLDERQILTDSLKSKNILFLGGNEKNILILVNDPEFLHLNEPDLIFLTKVLTQCNLTLADVCIINTKNTKSVSFNDIIDEINPSKIIDFGLNTSTLTGFSVSTKKYEVLNSDGISYLFAGNLENIKDDKAEKKELWNCLKKMFSIQ